ncbi:Uma2 family endonuclease [Streptomyces sp. NPDC002144]|uniref:Uma2 family endonuclease n=1 Tax=Streptomyces sp. NPDC006668 TaxID=3156903 RepID=UPI003409BCBD
MTVLEDRIEMADDSGELTLDELFESLERTTPEGYKVEIVEGTVFMSPQRNAHWQIIRRIVRALEDLFGMHAKIASDVRIDFPGVLNGLAPDVAKLRDKAVQTPQGGWYYGPKKSTYALAEIPVYLIVDPYQGKCHVYTQPKNGEYLTELSVTFGTDVDMTTTPLGLTLKTDEFPRD